MCRVDGVDEKETSIFPLTKRKALAASKLSKAQNRYNGTETENLQGRRVRGLR
jgi:hypothetical protein